MNTTQFFDEVDIELWQTFLSRSLGNEYYSWTRYIYISMLIIIFIIGVFGNLLTCFVIYCDRSMHTATNFYLFNLGVSDFILAFAVLLDIQHFINGTYQLGWMGCKIHVVSVLLLFNNGILTITALSIERCIAVCNPMKLKLKADRGRVLKIIAIVWFLALIETLSEVWTVQVIECDGFTLCFTVPTRYARLLNGILGIVSFVIPLTILLFVHTIIAVKVQANETIKSKGKVFNNRGSRKKVNKLIALTMSYLFCWTPFFLLRASIFLFNVENLMKRVQIWGLWYLLSTVNSWLSIVLNPLLFSMISSKFRKALKALWKKNGGLQRQTNLVSK